MLVASIDDLEEKIDRLSISNEIAYDEIFHNEIVNDYTRLVSKLVASKLTVEEKNDLSELLKVLFEKISKK